MKRRRSHDNAFLHEGMRCVFVFGGHDVLFQKRLQLLCLAVDWNGCVLERRAVHVGHVKH